MKKLLVYLLLLTLPFFSKGQCGGTMTLTSVPIRTNTTLAQAIRIGDGGNGQITVCIKEQHTDGKCGGNIPTLYVQYNDGSGTEAFVAIWDMRTTPTGTCYTFPLCNSYLYLKRTSCINNDGSNTIIEWTYTNYQGGDYKDRCTNTTLIPSPSIDCVNASEICGSGTYAGNTNGSGIQEIGCSGSPSNGGGCLLGGENNSAWYYFTAASNGTITFSIQPATNKDDYDFAVWGPDPTCTNLGNPIRCNFALNKGPTGLNTTATWTEEDGGCVSGGGCSNTGFSQQLTVTAGEVYYLLVDGYATAIDPNYTITIGGTASLVCTLPLSLEEIKPIVIKEEDMSEPLKIIHYHTINGKELTEKESTRYKGIVIVIYEDGTRGKLPIKIK